MADFRGDIQGLRAFAVFLVFIFHISNTALPGGFIGVDIFFVISGYLISAIILNKKERNNFIFVDFYIGRLKRIIPLYYVILSITIIAAVLIYLPSDILELRMNAFWSTIFMSNVYFSSLDTYFGASSLENPFLHTWTLSIEMQFYFILPLILYFINKKYISTVLITIILCSLLYSTLGTYYWNMKSQMYFSLPARIPEFCLGALLTVKQDYLKRFRPSVSNYISIASFIVILISAFLFSEKSNYPGYVVLFPCIATCFLLISKNSFLNSKIFSNKFSLHIGELSYSIYLWHWPLIALYRYYKNSYKFSLNEIAFLTISTYILSLLSYHTIENYFRKINNNKRFFALFSIPVIFLGLIAVLLPRLNTYYHNIPTEFSQPVFGIKSHSGSFEKIETFGDLNKETDSILLIGDSHALVYKNILHNLGVNNSFNFKTITNDRYINIPGLSSKDFSNRELFLQYSEIMKITNSEISKAKVIFICAVWFDDLTSLPEALDKFLKNIDDSQTVVILPDYPTLNNNPIRVNRDFIKNHDFNYSYVIEDNVLPSKIRNILRQFNNVHIIDIDFKKKFKDLPYNNDTIMYYDKGHLNLYGTKVISNQLENEFMSSINKIIQKEKK